jgi:O-antigen ligase
MYWLVLGTIFTVSFEDLAQLSGLSISKATGLIVAVFWVGTVLATGRFRTPRPFHLVVLLFVVWNVLSVFWSVDQPDTLRQLLTYVQLLGLVYIIWDTITTRSRLWAALQAYVLGALVSSVSLILDYLVGGAAQYQIRFGTGFGQINDFGLTLGLAIPAAWYLAMQEEIRGPIRHLRPVNLIYIPVSSIAVMLTGSRSGLLTILSSLFYVAFHLFQIRISRSVLAIAMLVGLFLVLRPLLPEKTVARQSAVVEGIAGRQETWREAYAAFRENPILGVGSAAFRTPGTQKTPHNFLLRFLAELGLVGFGLFALILLIIAWSARHQPDSRLFGLWVSLLIIWVIGASVHNFEAEKQTWVFFSLVVAGSGASVGVGASRHEALTGSPSDHLNRIADPGRVG